MRVSSWQAIWSYLRQFLYTKFVIVTDDDVDVRNWQEVIQAIATRSIPRDTHLPQDADRLSGFRKSGCGTGIYNVYRRAAQVAARDADCGAGHSA